MLSLGFPSLTLTAGTIRWLLNSLNIPLSVETVCVFTVPIFSTFASWATYLLTKDVKGAGAGLTAATLLAMVPSYISRSVAGSYDNEAVAIFPLIFTFYLYIKTLNTRSLFYATLNAMAYFYMRVLISHSIFIGLNLFFCGIHWIKGKKTESGF